MGNQFMQILLEFTDHLIEVMAVILAVALTFRLLASRASRRDQIYFKTFARALEKTLESEPAEQDVSDVEAWLTGILNKVSASLPNRSLRFGKEKHQAPVDAQQFRFRDKESLAEFADGKKSIVHGIKLHIDVLKSPYPPNFAELADRILDHDRQWKTVGGVQIEVLSRMLDILPGLFVIGGILGTFVGIAVGLPKIGMIDMSKIQESSPILTSFIDSVALSMRTSIAGILYSIAMTVLNAMFPIHAQRIDVEKSVQRSMEIVWHRIHGHKPSYADSQIIGLLEKINDSISRRKVA